MIPDIHYTWFGYLGSGDSGLYLTKPLTFDVLNRFQNLRGLKIELDKGEFRNIDHDEYFRSIIHAKEYEEIIITNSGKLTKIDHKLWRPSLRSFMVDNLDCGDIPYFSNRLEYLSIRKSHSLSTNLLSSKNFRELKLFNITTSVTLNSFYPNLKKLQLGSMDQITLDFQYYPNVEELEILNIKELNIFNFEKLNNLKYLRLYQIGNNVNISRYVNLPNLEKVSIQDSILNFDGVRCVSENMRELTYWMPNSSTIPSALVNQNLEKVNLSLLDCHYIPEIILSKNLKNITLHVDKGNFGELNWKNCSQLEQIKFVVNKNTICNLPSFDEAQNSLEEIEVNAQSLHVDVPSTWANCPKIKRISFRVLELSIVETWSCFDSLQNISLYNINKISGFNRLLHNKNLVQIYISRVDIFKWEDKDVYENIVPLLNKYSISVDARNVLSRLLTEINPSLDHNEKFYFFELLNVKNENVRNKLFSHLHLINAPFDATDTILYASKSYFIGSKLKKSKQSYIDKFNDLCMLMHKTIQSDTFIILLGENNVDLPPEFWNYPHYFITEKEIHNNLQSVKPGFVQEFADDNLQGIRELIWSNDPHNDKLVVEMVKHGGIHDNLLGDLFVLAKTSQDTSIRNDLRKLLKTVAKPFQLKALSNSRDLEKAMSYYTLENLDSISVTAYKRMNVPLDSFFRSSESIRNPFREEMFQIFFGQKNQLIKNTVINLMYVFLTKSELYSIFDRDDVKSSVKTLYLKSLEDLPENIIDLKLDTLDLQMVNSSTFPIEISSLKNLKYLTFRGLIQVFPSELLGLKKLKRIQISSPNSKNIIVPEELKSIVNFY